MSQNLATIRRFGLTVLAVSLMACGTVQGATPGRAGTQIEAPRGDNHLIEFDVNDTSTTTGDASLQQAMELDRQNEQQRLAEQGARHGQAADEGQYCGLDMPQCNAISGPVLVP